MNDHPTTTTSERNTVNATGTTFMLVLACVCAALLGGGALTRSHAAEDAPAAKKQAPGGELQRLLTERFESATKVLQLEEARNAAGASTLENVCQAAQRLLVAEMELRTTADERMDAMSKHVVVMRRIEQDVADRFAAGTIPRFKIGKARDSRLGAEIELLRLKRSAGTREKAPDEDLRQLLSERSDCATEALRLARERLAAGAGTNEEIIHASQRLLSAELELNPTAENRVAATTKHVELTRDLEECAVNRFDAGTVPRVELEKARCRRLSAEIELLRLKRATAAKRWVPGEELQRLLTERFETAIKVLPLETERWYAGVSSVDDVCQAAQLAFVAEMELSTTAKGRLAVTAKHAAVMRELEQNAVSKFDAGMIPRVEVEKARYWRASAEIELLRLQRSTTKKGRAK